MKVSIGIGGAASGGRRNFDQDVEFVVEAEKLGVDTVWSAEAWGQDAIAPLAYLAARTERIRLGTGIMQISARAPSMTAMTALTMASISNDRFILGLGVSGPQVVEGLQGRPFKAPLTRMRETVDILKLAFAGERIAYQGRYHQLPLPGGEGKALRLAQPGNDRIPIYLATLGPNALEYTGEAADGWIARISHQAASRRQKSSWFQEVDRDANDRAGCRLRWPCPRGSFGPVYTRARARTCSLNRRPRYALGREHAHRAKILRDHHGPW